MGTNACKLALLLGLLVAFVHGIPIVSHKNVGSDCAERFEAFKGQHGKVYASAKEHKHRLGIFCSNLKEIDEINAKGTTWKAGVNAHSDMSAREFMDAFTMHVGKPQSCSATEHPSKYVTISSSPPTTFDWRNQTCGETSCVSMVKNQGKCGSCWTFSTVGAMEAVNAINTGMMTLFSEQQLVDCAQDFKNLGCFGGLPSQAFEYIHYAGGLSKMEDYPYVCGDGHCGNGTGFCKKTISPAATVKAVVNFTEGDEKSMMAVVGVHNPVSVAFEVVPDLRHYASGVYQSTVCNSTDDSVNHAVLAVGYGNETGTPFWTIKNSWSEGWGNRGYFNILRGSNMCGIATCASFPVLDAKPPSRD